jgi:hypothetical protein
MVNTVNIPFLIIEYYISHISDAQRPWETESYIPIRMQEEISIENGSDVVDLLSHLENVRKGEELLDLDEMIQKATIVRVSAEYFMILVVNY